jgi:hypothetical protein
VRCSIWRKQKPRRRPTPGTWFNRPQPTSERGLHLRWVVQLQQAQSAGRHLAKQAVAEFDEQTGTRCTRRWSS